jgi:uncharacterized protein (DUF433 family)
MVYGAIKIKQSTQDGIPVFSGTTVPIQLFFEYLEEGKSIETFLHDHPAVNQSLAREVLQMARLALTTERILQENFTADE